MERYLPSGYSPIKLPLITTVCLLFLFPLQSTAQQAIQDSLLQLINAHPKNDERKAELLNALSYNIHSTDPKQGLAYAEQVIDFAGNLKEKGHLSLAYMTKGINLMQLAEYNEALDYFNLSLEGFRKGKDKANLASSISNIGVIYKHLNVYPKALSHMQEAALIFKEIGHPHELFMYANMAVIYTEQKNVDKAMEYYMAAKQGAIQSGNKRVEAYAMSNMGTLLIEQDKPREGLRYLDSALLVSKEINDNMMIARIYGNMGMAHNNLKDYAQSLAFNNLAINLNDSIGNKKSRAFNLLNLGDIYFNMGNLSLAGKYGRQAYQEGKSLKTKDVQRDAAKNLSAYFEKIGNSDSALFYYRQHILFRDSIDNEENKQQITRMEMQYDFDLKEQEYIKEQQIAKLTIRQFWLYGTAILVALFASAIVFIQRSRMKTFHLNSKIKENELQQRAESLLLEQKISDSELKAIRSQMNPHFIFNVLNSIESYILDNDPKTASMLVQKFAALSRLVLENSTQSLVTLDREWDAVRLYVELESIRFDHQFSYTFAYQSDLPADTLLIPPMLIQPLLENAIHHGLRHLKDYKGELHTTISDTGDKLVITVADNGIGMAHSTQLTKPSALKQQSLGITGIKERIAIINARQEDSPASFTLHDLYESGEKGTKAILVLPLVFVERSVEA